MPINARMCKCGRLLPLSHKGPCPDCGKDPERVVIHDPDELMP